MCVCVCIYIYIYIYIYMYIYYTLHIFSRYENISFSHNVKIILFFNFSYRSGTSINFIHLLTLAKSVKLLIP